MAMPPEDNKEIVRAYWEEFVNQGNLALADDLLAADFVVHDSRSSEEEDGSEVMKGTIAIIHELLPDAWFVIEDEIAEGDRVASRWRASGSLRAELRSGDGPDYETTASGITFFRISEGKIQEMWQGLEGPGDEAPTIREDRLDFLLEDPQFWDRLGYQDEESRPIVLDRLRSRCCRWWDWTCCW